MLFAFIFLLLLSPSELVKNESTKVSLTAPQRLFEDLFRYYNKGLRPMVNQSHPLSVAIHSWFKQILKVDEIDQTLSVYCWLELYWQDQFLTWNPSDYDGIDLIHVPATDVWKPDIIVYNGANMNVKENEVETNVVIKSNGEMLLFKSVITDIACSLDMTYFPFDEQICYVMLASWSHDGSKLSLSLRDTKSYLDFYVSNTEWTLLDFKSKKKTRIYECCPVPYPEILYFFTMERNPAYYILSLIIPSAFITVVTIIGFFTPHSSTGETNEKVSLGVTALLSLGIILLMVADKMPATSRVMPLIGKYYIGLIATIFLAACTTIVTLTIQLWGNAGIPPSKKWLKRLKLAAKFIFVSLDGVENLEHDFETETKIETSESAYLVNNEWRYQGETPMDNWPTNFQRRHLNKRLNNWRAELDSTGSGTGVSRSDIFCEELMEIGQRIEEELGSLNRFFNKEQEKSNAKKQWAFVARVTERCLMVLYLFSTLSFAYFMLTRRGEHIVLSEQRMNSVLTS